MRTVSAKSAKDSPVATGVIAAPWLGISEGVLYGLADPHHPLVASEFMVSFGPPPGCGLHSSAQRDA
ncbi:hypothetical protein SynA1562_02248 [Synechococcus sp. A15-62]|nr:hypothetical protein SynA1562_02248 [Synechococcus sp. A15-62]